MGDDPQIHKPAAIAAVFILLVVAVLVRIRAFVTGGTSRGEAHRRRRRLNTMVDFAPLTGIQVQQANHGADDTDGQGQAHYPRAHHPQAHHRLHVVDSVTSLRYPPPAYPAHHLDPLYDGTPSGYGDNGLPVGNTVDVVLVPLPPSYTTQPGGGHLPL